MAESKAAVAVVPLNSTNYATWKIQCKMALVKEGLWGIVSGTETAPAEGADQQARFAARRDKALATIVLAVEPSLLYLVGADPTDPGKVWKTLADQFQRKTWANKLELKRKLFSMRLNEGESVQEHIKCMTELCDELSAIGEPVNEEDRVVYLLASLPETYSVLVTALEASTDVPTLAVVTERLLHEETKRKGRNPIGQEEALAANIRKRPICYFCRKPGHIKRECEEYAKHRDQARPVRGKKSTRMGAFKVTITPADDQNDPEDESTGLVVQHALVGGSDTRDQWILDSGATCHMCNDKSMFYTLQALPGSVKVTLGDGRSLQAVGRGSVTLNMKLSHNKAETCTLHDVLLVPDLAFNLLSITSASKRGKVTVFTNTKCEIRNSRSKLVATGRREGSLYFLNQGGVAHLACPSSDQNNSREMIWHRRYGHLGSGGLQTLVKKGMVNGMDFNCERGCGFCECCVEGKGHRLPFQQSTRERTEHPLELVHSDVCGKVGTKSLGGSEYFVTFIDDHTRHVWVYILKRKDEVFQRFKEWRALVEKSSGKQIKTLRTDNGGEYTSTEFTSYLLKEGIKHELTAPHTPQQNGVAERLNRTLVEGVRTMLADSKLPKKFWAEALSTKVYLWNRSPTKALEEITPHEAWSGNKPDVSFLRVFGCRAYAHKPRVERSKLDSKTRRCVLLGYGTDRKCYRLYDLERMKVIHSRDVILDENTVSGIQNDGESVNKYVELEVEKGADTQKETELDVEAETSTESVVIPIPTDIQPEEEQPEESQTVTPNPSECGLRRSSRSKQKPERYSHNMTLCSSEQQDPTTVDEARSSPENLKWIEAMSTEMDSLRSNNVWELVEPPPNRKIIGSKWVFKRKIDAQGTVQRYKARLVAQGCTQKFGVDYEETFSPVARFESVRTVIALGAQHQLQLHQMDVSTAFLHGKLSEEVYMEQPEGFIEPGNEHLVCHLKRSIYGLKQSPRCWNHALDGQLKEMGFKQTSSDPCLYVKFDSEGEMLVVAVYVDDLILGGGCEVKLNEVKKELGQAFRMKDLGKLHHFLGVKIIQDKHSGVIWIGQPLYTETMLQKFGMLDCKPVDTPVSTGVKPVSGEESEESCDQQLYQAVIGSLLYLSTKTRPDIAYAVSCAARFCAKPTKQHWSAVKRILRYLKGTSRFGLAYKGDTANAVTGYSDADWAGDVGDRKSTSGYVFMLGGAAISWRSSKQTCVALSTAEAEYIALSAAAQEAAWLQKLVSDLLNKNIQETVILEDNQSAICLAKNQQVHGRTKHIDIKYHFVRNMVEAGKIKLTYCASKDMVADMLTKGIPANQFEKLRELAGVKLHRE